MLASVGTLQARVNKRQASLVSSGIVPGTETRGWFQGCLFNTTHITRMVSAGKKPWMEKKAVPSFTRAGCVPGWNQDCTAAEHWDRATVAAAGAAVP